MRAQRGFGQIDVDTLVDELLQIGLDEAVVALQLEHLRHLNIARVDRIAHLRAISIQRINEFLVELLALDDAGELAALDFLVKNLLLLLELVLLAVHLAHARILNHVEELFAVF